MLTMRDRALHCYNYVNRSYADVREVLHRHPLDLLHRATTSAATRARPLAATLHTTVGAIEVGVNVHVHIHGVTDEKAAPDQRDVTRVEIRWEADRAPALFPSMHATLSASRLSPTETQLEIDGEYNPPLGPVGTAVDAWVGHRLAEAVVHQLLEDVVRELQREIPEAPITER
jgi:hypothetical protein